MNSASHPVVQRDISRARLRALVVPREHGAWGILLVPLSTGAALAVFAESYSADALVCFVLAAIALFWLRTPVESLLGTTPLRANTEAERDYVKAVIAGISGFAGLMLLALLYQGRVSVLAVLGAVAGIAFAVQAWIKRFGRRMRAPAQIIGSLGLTSTAAAAHYVATGHLGRVAITLWMLNFLFAAEQIQSVQLRIRSARVNSRGERVKRAIPLLASEAGIVVAVLLLWYSAATPFIVLAAFLPAIARTWAWILGPTKPLDVHRLGWSELANGILFGVLAVSAYVI